MRAAARESTRERTISLMTLVLVINATLKTFLECF